jgi:hypothetical protein
MKNNEDKTFILINCLKYVTITINYCAAISAVLEDVITTDPHLVVLCVTTSVLRIRPCIPARNPSLVVHWQGSSVVY